MFTFIFARISKRVLESLALASSLSVLDLEATCPWQLDLGLGLEGCVLAATLMRRTCIY